MRGLTTSFLNMAYCGPPVLTAVLDSSGMLAVVVGNLVAALVMISLTLVLLGGGASPSGDPSGARSSSRWCC